MSATVTRTLNGSYTVSDIIAGQWIERTYFGYTKREAVSRYKKEMSQVKK